MKNQGVALFGKPGLGKSLMLKIAKDAIGSPERLAELMDALFHEKYRICQQAAWCLSLVADNRPDLLLPYFPQLMSILEGHEKQSGGTLRNTLRIIKLLEPPTEYEEKLIYHCFELVADVHQPIAIRAFSLYLLGRTSLRVPEIQGELRDLIDYHFDNESAAFKSTSKQVLKMIKKRKDQ